MATERKLSQEQIDAAETAIGRLFKEEQIDEESLISLHRQYLRDAGPVTVRDLIEAVAGALRN